MNTAKAIKYYTREEYLAKAMASPVKLEYHNGIIIEAMVGGTINHSKIKSDTFLFLGNSSKKCQIFDSDMVVQVEAYNRYLYPDMSFVCDKKVLTDESQLLLLNPALIIEVLSPNTKSIDQGDKFSWYRSIPSFKEYVLIQSDFMGIESWYKEEENLWRIQSADKTEQSIHLHTLGMDLPLKEVYKRVSFT